MIPPSAAASWATRVLSFCTDVEMPEEAAVGGFIGPAASQPATRTSARTKGTVSRRIWGLRRERERVLGAPKMRLPRVHLQHTSSLK